MEEYSFTPQQKKLSNLAFWEVGLLEFFLAIAVLLLLFVILNYFNVLSVSGTFPNQLGWLPKQAQQKSIPASQEVKFNLCKPFSLANTPVKITCQKAVETALADTPGKPTKITFAPLRLEPVLIKTLARQRITIPNTSAWIIEIALDKPITLQNGKKALSLRVQIPADGTKAIYRTPITL
jgi:hypothetical protein